MQTNPCQLDDMPIGAMIGAYVDKADGVLLQREVEARRLGYEKLYRIFLAPGHRFRRSSTQMALHRPKEEQVMPAVRTLSARQGARALPPPISDPGELDAETIPVAASTRRDAVRL